MIRSLALIGCVCAAGVLAYAQTANPRQLAPTPRGDSTLRMLNMRIPEVVFQDQPFESVMEWVQDFTQANVQVRWQILEDNGIERDKAITLKVKNLRLSQVMWMIMNEAGGTDVKLAYRAAGNLIIFSTEEDLAKEMVVKVYDVSDLMVEVPRFDGESRLDPGQALQQQGQGGSGGGGGGGGLFGNSGGQNDEYGQNENNNGRQAGMQELIDLITGTIEPDSWAANAGTGTIQPFRNMLVVRNTLLVHQRLGGWLVEAEAASSR